MTEIDRLARLLDPSIGDEVGGDVNYVLRRSAKIRNARTAVERILSNLAENPPECAVEAMDNRCEFHDVTADEIFTAAINAIRGEK